MRIIIYNNRDSASPNYNECKAFEVDEVEHNHNTFTFAAKNAKNNVMYKASLRSGLNVDISAMIKQLATDGYLIFDNLSWSIERILKL